MKNILFILLLLTISSCALLKEAKLDDINNKVNNLDTLLVDNQIIRDSVITEDTLFREVNKLVVSEMQIIKDDRNLKREQNDIKSIEKHEKKTKLKVVDITSKVSDPNKGWIAYSVPEEMKVAKSYSVKVRISKKDGQSKAQLILGDHDAINNPEYPSVATIEDVRVSGEMSAELRGDIGAFKIVALSTLSQNIDNESYTEWEWYVTPLKGGQSPLKLVVILKDLNKDIVVFNRVIKVKTNVPVAVESFFDKYWTWLISTFVIPLFLYYRNRKNNKKEKKS
jgi:hypothetical protein